MKILWLSSAIIDFKTYSKVSERLSWISSLEKIIKSNNQIELEIAFLAGTRFAKKQFDNTNYYSLPQYKSIWSKIINKLIFNDTDYSFIKILVNIINETKPDIIQIFGTESPFGLIAKHSHVPTVIHIQGNLSSYLYKWFYGSYSQWNSLINASPYKLLTLNSIFFNYYMWKKNIKRELEIFKINQNYMGRTLWDRKIIEILHVQNNYFHCEEMLRAEFYGKEHSLIKPESGNHKELILVSILGNNTYKGLDLVFYAASILKFQMSLKFTWNIIGIGPNSEIVRISKSLTGFRNELNNNLAYFNKLDVTALINELLKADIYIHPSYIENSSNSICEAMILGKPIIANYVGGIPGLIENNYNGILVPAGEPFEMAYAINELSKDTKRKNMLGKNAKATASKRHDPEQIQSQLLNCYKSIINK